MGSCMGRITGDNETVSVSSVNVSRPATSKSYLKNLSLYGISK